MSAAALRALGRLLSFAGVVLGASALFGALLWVAPGARPEAGGGLLSWLLDFWIGAARGDLGRSYRGYPITELVLRGAGRTLPIVTAAGFLSLCVALAGALLLPRRGRARWLRGAAHALSLTPVFLLGYLAVVFFAVPPRGAGQLVAAVLILALGDGMFSDALADLSGEVDQLRRRPFVLAARLRGEGLWRHVTPHLLLPMARLAASKAAFLLGGVLVVEMVLGIQGLGLMGYRAAQHADFPLLLAISVFITALVAGMQLLVDLIRIAVDPRQRESR